MKCKNCGMDLPEGSTVCFECGVSQVETVIPATTNVQVGEDPFTTPVPITTKSKVGAAVLALFLGAFGGHNFYLGFTSKAVIQILLTFVTCGTVGTIWGIVDFIRILCGNIKVDAKGNPII